MSIDRLYNCIKTKKANQSQAREAVYRVLLDSEECLTVSEIASELAAVYPRNISINTIYRHLSLFTSCKLVVVIQDDYKRAYYCLAEEAPMVFTICSRCNCVEKRKIDSSCAVAWHLGSSDFITIHKKCKKCR